MKLTPFMLTLALFTGTVFTGFAQGTAFTYQGRLNDGNGPASGTYDMAFKLFNTNTTGVAIAGPVTNSTTAVSNGLFTAIVNFGAGVFTGGSNWLEIAVRTNGAASFSTLAPRQQLTPTPYAMYAINAAMAGSATSASSAVTATSAGTFSGALVGDVTGTEGATVVAAVGGQIAANVAGGASAANAASAANTAGTIVKRDVSGNFAAGTITAAAFTGNGASLTSLNAGNLASGTVPSGQLSGTYGNALTFNNAGNSYTGSSLTISASRPGGWGNSAVNFLNPTATTNNAPALRVVNVGGTNGDGALSVSANVQPGLPNGLIAEFGNANSFVAVITNDGTIYANGFVGNGTNLSNLNASQLTGGVITNSVLPGFQGNDNAIGGGVGNSINGLQSAILGGQNNTNNANQSAIGGGGGNLIQTGAYYAFVGGGGGNLIQTNAYDSVIGGGYHNTVQSNAIVSVIGGGQFNTITNNASFSVLAGGLNNTNTGPYSVIAGGKNNLATSNSFAAGSYAQATNSGSFVWSDNSSTTPFGSTNINSFNVRATGGVNLVTGGTGVALDGAAILTATPGAIQESEINDGGSAAYTAFQQTVQASGGDTSLAFSQLYPVAATNGSTPSLTLTVNGAALGTVMGFAGCEAISQPYAYVVEVLNSTTINPANQIGLTSSLSFSRNGNVTTFGGIITACTLASSDGTGFLYTFKIESPLASLNLTTDYNIYQNKAANTVAASVYTTVAGVAAITQSLTGTYPVHSSLTQFGETALNFFNRILENEGIFYFFNQSVSPPSLILGDNTGAYLASPNSPFTYYGNAATNIPTGTEYIRTFQNAVHQSTKTSTVRAYDFETPAVTLQGSSSATAGVGLYYEFGNPVATTTYDASLAATREGVQTENRAAISGSATAPDLRAGYTFTLTDQTGAGLGNNYLVTGIHHAGFVRVTNGVSTFFYGNEFTAIPASITYQPTLRTPKPVAQPCAAVVTGAAGDEIFTDKYARVKVLFHWDHYDTADDTSSAWIRVASPWAGNGRGLYFIPRVGDEVLVSYIQGDPDQPVITGSLYNGVNLPPYSLPANKTRSGLMTSSSPGGNGNNELRFEDKTGAEEIYLSAQRDLNQTINNNVTEQVGNNMTLSVANNLTVAAGSQIALNGTVNVNGMLNGNGSGLTNLSASQLTSGAVPSAVLPSDMALVDASQTFNGVNTFIKNVNVNGYQAGIFSTPLVLMQNSNLIGNTAPVLRMVGLGYSPSGVLSVSSQGTGLIAQFGNANSFVADITTNGTVEASGLRVGGSGTTLANFQAGQAQMAGGSSLAATNFILTFPKTFNTIPKVVLTANTDPGYTNYGDTFVVSVRIATTTNCLVNVIRIDSAAGWSETLRVNWIAWE